MKQYKVVDVDYTNCHPVIAEALKQGKHIWCYNPTRNEPHIKVMGYSGKNHDIYPYSASNGTGFAGCYSRTWVPVETKKKFKSAPEIIQWCIDNDWVISGNEVIIFVETYKPHSHTLKNLHINLIKFYAGKVYNPDEIHDMYIHPDWLEEMI